MKGHWETGQEKKETWIYFSSCSSTFKSQKGSCGQGWLSPSEGVLNFVRRGVSFPSLAYTGLVGLSCSWLGE